VINIFNASTLDLFGYGQQSLCIYWAISREFSWREFAILFEPARWMRFVGLLKAAA
jgi:hypothetical protein